MLNTIIYSSLVLLLQTGFYFIAGTKAYANSNVTLSENNIINEEFNGVHNEKDVLFVVKHCKSPNVVVYEAKRTEKRDLDPKKPVDVYWLMNTKGKKIESLTYLEWEMAFGFKLQTLLKGKKYKISLNAIKKREIIISQNQQGEVEGLMNINGTLSKLKEVFIKFDPSFLIPDVEYVDFSGVDLKSGKLVSERIYKD